MISKLIVDENYTKMELDRTWWWAVDACDSAYIDYI